MRTKTPGSHLRPVASPISASDNSCSAPTLSRFSFAASSDFYRFLVRRRVAISVVLFIALLTTEGLMGIGWHHVGLRSGINFGIAVAFVLLGVGVRSWAAGTIRKNSQLAMSGAYSVCRHPLYLGSFLMIFGFCLGTQPQINLLLVTPLIAVMYSCAIQTEELWLAANFAKDWKHYAATTPRLLPNPFALNLRRAPWSLAQWKANREYQGVFGAMAGICGMFAWYMWG